MGACACGHLFELGADAVRELQREVACVHLGRERLADLVRAGEQVRVVRARVVVARPAVLLPERADLPLESDVREADVRRHGDIPLRDPQLGARVVEPGVGEVVGLKAYGADDVGVAVVEKDLGPGLLPLPRVAPVEVLIVGHEGAVQVRGALTRARARDKPCPAAAADHRARVLSGAAGRTVADADAQRRAKVAVREELPIVAGRGRRRRTRSARQAPGRDVDDGSGHRGRKRGGLR